MESDQITPDTGAEATVPPVVDETSTESPLVAEKISEPDKFVELETKLRKEFTEQLGEKEKHWQSVSERQSKALRSEAKGYRKRAEGAESQITAFNEMAVRDPRIAAQIRATQVQAKARAFEEQGARDQQEQNTKEFFSVLEEGLVDDSIDPEDERIDWGTDAPDPIQAMRRFNASVSKIKKENAKNVEDKRGQEIKDLEVRLRKELGMDSADKTIPAGAGSSDDFLAKWNNGELPYTQANLDRANKLLSE